MSEETKKPAPKKAPAKAAAPKTPAAKPAAPKSTAPKATTAAKAPVKTAQNAKVVEKPATAPKAAAPKVAAPKPAAAKADKPKGKAPYETAGEITVIMVHGTQGCTKRQIRTVMALGLRKIGDKKVHKDNPAIRGMCRIVEHLVKVEKV